MNLRLDAARTVANLIYPRLSAIDVNAHGDQPMVVQVIKFADMPIEDRRTEDRLLIDLIADGTDAIGDDDASGEADAA